MRNNSQTLSPLSQSLSFHENLAKSMDSHDGSHFLKIQTAQYEHHPIQWHFPKFCSVLTESGPHPKIEHTINNALYIYNYGVKDFEINSGPQKK